jgi:hypothetical protein
LVASRAWDLLILSYGWGYRDFAPGRLGGLATRETLWRCTHAIDFDLGPFE